MNIFLNNQIQRNRTLLDIMFGRKVQNTKTNKNMQSGRRDTVTISSEARELSMKKSISGRTRNTSVDSTIDLQKYIDAARESNRAALENAGSEIDVNAVTYTDSSEACRGVRGLRDIGDGHGKTRRILKDACRLRGGED